MACDVVRGAVRAVVVALGDGAERDEVVGEERVAQGGVGVERRLGVRIDGGDEDVGARCRPRCRKGAAGSAHTTNRVATTSRLIARAVRRMPQRIAAA
jgi:hypothetical protein